MKRALVLLVLISLFVPACAKPHARRFDYEDIHLEISGRVVGGEGVAALPQAQEGFARLAPVKQVVIEAKIVEVRQDDLAVLGIWWWPGQGSPIEPTTLTDTSPDPVPLNVGFGFGFGLGGGGGGNSSNYPDQQSSSGGGISMGPSVGVGVPVDLSGGATSVEALFNISPTVTVDNSLLMMLIATERAANGKIIAQPVILTLDSIQADIPVEAIPKAEATTTALIDNGETIVIGGLIRSEQEVIDKVPLLGDLPLLGHLFKSNALVENKDLLIFVTPRILVQE